MRQVCPELACEAVEFVAPPADAGLDAPPAPLVLLAIDATLDAPDLEALQAALLDVRSSLA